MRRGSVVAVSALWTATGLGLTPPAVGQEPGAAAEASHLEAFDADVRRFAQQLELPGLLVAVVHDGEAIHSVATGYADVESSEPITADHLFWIASVTKTMTAVLMMQMDREGVIDLDDPVTSHWFDGFFPIRVSPDYALRHVLGHTAQGSPGRTFVYHGGRFNFVYGAFEELGVGAFKARLVEGIIDGLGLDSTMPGVGDDRTRALLERLVTPYRYDPSSGTHVEAPDVFQFGDVYPATGVATTVGDLARYAKALDDHELLSPEADAEMTRAAVSTDGRTLPYGIGWFVQDVRGTRLLWHYGYGTADSALFMRVPERKLTLIALANSDQMSAATRHEDGSVLSSPIAVSFLRHFVRSGSARHRPPDYEAEPEAIRAWLTSARGETGYGLDLDGLFAAATARSHVERRMGGEGGRAATLLRVLYEASPEYFERGDLLVLDVLADNSDPAYDAATSRLIDRLLAEQPENPGVYAAAARFHEERGEMEEALGYRTRLVGLSGYEEDEEMLNTLVWLGEHLADADRPAARRYLWRAKVAMFRAGNEDRTTAERIDRALAAVSGRGP